MTAETKSKTKPSTKSDQPHEHVELPGNIDDLFHAAQEAERLGKLNDYEKDFVVDNSKRYARWGADLYLSPLQLQFLQRCAAKLEPEGEDPLDPQADDEVTE